MSESKNIKQDIWKQLDQHADTMGRPEKHLKHLISEKGRLENFSLTGGGIFYDFSRQRIDEKGLTLLLELAESLSLIKTFHEMMNGEKVNGSEKRAALHTATRQFSSEPLFVDGTDVMPEIIAGRDNIKSFAGKVHSGAITGSTGKPFKHIVIIGIGGSYLGAEFVGRALSGFADKGLSLHFLSNVDIHNFSEILSKIDPETTLWIVISKSYTTAETLANMNQAYSFMKENKIPPEQHVITVTAKGSPGHDPSTPVLASFDMFDYIGGRYSVTSAVGGVPLSLYLGYDRFEQFLKGAEEMDLHAKNASPDKNLPLIAALLGVWNNNFLGYPAAAIIPYATPLCKLAPHIQQLYMESNGKSVTTDGKDLEKPAGVIVFGEPGTNAQHSFFQLAHQGRPFPIDFIGVVNPSYDGYESKSKGVTNHQELWANLISQPAALATGHEQEDKARSFSGNRPSSTLILKDLSPENIGRLLSFYEAKTVLEAFVWDINPFDQFGVELGKTTASNIRNEISERNINPQHSFNRLDDISRYYLNVLFSGDLV